MPRIVGVDVPEKKKIRFALRYIHGVGPKIADVILEKTGISPDKRASELTEQEIATIASLIDAEFQVEGVLRRLVSQNIARLKEIRCYRGDRHRKGLPCRGQRTRSNARTRKGKKKTVAGKKGVKG